MPGLVARNNAALLTKIAKHQAYIDPDTVDDQYRVLTDQLKAGALEQRIAGLLSTSEPTSLKDLNPPPDSPLDM